MNFACTESSVKSAKNWLKRLKMVAEFSHRFPTMSPQNMQMFIMAETAEKTLPCRCR